MQALRPRYATLIRGVIMSGSTVHIVELQLGFRIVIVATNLRNYLNLTFRVAIAYASLTRYAD